MTSVSDAVLSPTAPLLHGLRSLANWRGYYQELKVLILQIPISLWVSFVHVYLDQWITYFVVCLEHVPLLACAKRYSFFLLQHLSLPSQLGLYVISTLFSLITGDYSKERDVNMVFRFYGRVSVFAHVLPYSVVGLTQPPIARRLFSSMRSAYRSGWGREFCTMLIILIGFRVVNAFYRRTSALNFGIPINEVNELTRAAFNRAGPVSASMRPTGSPWAAPSPFLFSDVRIIGAQNVGYLSNIFILHAQYL